MDSQYKLLSELLSDQAAFITSPKTRLANYWGALPPCPPVSTGLYGTSLKPFLQPLRQDLKMSLKVLYKARILKKHFHTPKILRGAAPPKAPINLTRPAAPPDPQD